MQKIAVREYSKRQLRILLANPESNPDNPTFDLQRPMSERKFTDLMKRIVTVHCRKHLTLEDYRKCKIVPAKVVAIVLEKLEL